MLRDVEHHVPGYESNSTSPSPFPFHSFSIFFDEEKNHRYSATFPNNSLKFNSIHENKSSETLADDSWKRDDSRFLFRLFLPISYKNKMIRTIKDRSTWSKENSRSSDRRTKEKQRKSASSWEERAFWSTLVKRGVNHASHWQFCQKSSFHGTVIAREKLHIRCSDLSRWGERRKGWAESPGIRARFAKQR